MRAQKEIQPVRDIKTKEETFYNGKKTKETLPWSTATPRG